VSGGVAEHFVFLGAQLNVVSGRQLLTRSVGIQTSSLDVLVAVDVDGDKHLLIPVGASAVDGDQASQGVTLGSRILRTVAGDVAYADLHCRITSLDLVFERLADDILQRLAVDGSAPVTTCRKVLDEWRALLKAAGRGITREALVGLVGELEVLRLLASYNPAGALDAWRGPSKSVHDFVRGAAEIEVKTTTSVDGNFVSISNIDQLDPMLVESLHLVVVHAREDITAPHIDERVAELIRMGVPAGALAQKIADAGYLYGEGAEIEDRFSIRSVRAWTVGDNFPGLRRSGLGEGRLRGVSKIRYELALDSAPRRISDKDFKNFVMNWIGIDGRS
jgi:hypothetical protein